MVWFRDYAAYCGLAMMGDGGLVAVVAELERTRRWYRRFWTLPMLNAAHPVCATPTWQRTPIRVTIDATAGQAMTLDVL